MRGQSEPYISSLEITFRDRAGTSEPFTVTLDINQARLFCNLTRSYILFLLAEHQSLRP